MLLSGVVIQQKIVCPCNILGFSADLKLIKEGNCKIRMRALVAWSYSTVFPLHCTFIRFDVTSTHGTCWFCKQSWITDFKKPAWIILYFANEAIQKNPWRGSFNQKWHVLVPLWVILYFRGIYFLVSPSSMSLPFSSSHMRATNHSEHIWSVPDIAFLINHRNRWVTLFSNSLLLN